MQGRSGKEARLPEPPPLRTACKFPRIGLEPLRTPLAGRGFRGAQKRCPYPLHRGDNPGRSFTVNLDDNVSCCHDPNCSKKGDVIDLWAAVHGLSLRQAAVDLAETFHLEPAPSAERRRGHG